MGSTLDGTARLHHNCEPNERTNERTETVVGQQGKGCRPDNGKTRIGDDERDTMIGDHG